MEFNHTEKRLIRGMYKLSRLATVNEIAIESDNMSWNTAKSTLLDLEKKEVVKKKELNGKEVWLLNYDG